MLFDPIKINKMELKNRVYMAPMAVDYPPISDEAAAFYLERAKGGAAAISVGFTYVDMFNAPGFAEGYYNKVVKPCQELGTKFGMQLFYGNNYPAFPEPGRLTELVAPSPGLPPSFACATGLLGINQRFPYCRELTKAEIKEIIGRYAQGAKYLKDIGYDFLEVHACHEHNLIHQFFTPIDNNRTDEYGGSLENRMRFALETAQALREAVGPDYPIIWRMCASDDLKSLFARTGYTVDEGIALAKELEKYVDCISVTYGNEESDPYYPSPSSPSCIPLYLEDKGCWIDYAAEFKKNLSVPVITVGRIHTSDIAEKTLQEGKADIIAIGRQLLCDPYWPKKVEENREEDIRPCLSCNYCVGTLDDHSEWSSTHEGGNLRCCINPVMAMEKDYAELKPAQTPKKILVIGAGPSGMQAAITAAQRGHQVSLYEKSDKVGGQANLAAVPPKKGDIAKYVKYLELQVKKAGVDLRLNTEVNMDVINDLNPDEIILSAGGNPIMPNIPGIDGPNVVVADDVLNGSVKLSGDIVVIGGGVTGCETAEILSLEGCKVSVLDIARDFATSLSVHRQHTFIFALAEAGVNMHGETTCKKITEEGVYVDTLAVKDFFIPADKVVIAIGVKPNNGLAKELEAAGRKVHVIGDCLQSGNFRNATHTAYKVAFDI